MLRNRKGSSDDVSFSAIIVSLMSAVNILSFGGFPRKGNAVANVFACLYLGHEGAELNLPHIALRHFYGLKQAGEHFVINLEFRISPRR